MRRQKTNCNDIAPIVSSQLAPKSRMLSPSNSKECDQQLLVDVDHLSLYAILLSKVMSLRGSQSQQPAPRRLYIIYKKNNGAVAI